MERSRKLSVQTGPRRRPARKGTDNRGELSGLRGLFFFFQAEDGIRDLTVTGVQTCALPILVAGVEPIATTQVAGSAVLRVKVVHLIEAVEADECSAVPLAGVRDDRVDGARWTSEEHTAGLQSQSKLVCRLLLDNKSQLLYRD